MNPVKRTGYFTDIIGMKNGKVGSVSPMSARQRSREAAKKRKKRQWGVQFLEFLVEEIGNDGLFEDEEREAGQKEGTEEKRSCQITVKTMEETRICEAGEKVEWKRDTLELSGERVDEFLTSEIYADIIDSVKQVGKWKADVLYKVAEEVMRRYYDRRLTADEVEELFICCYQSCTRNAALTVKKREEVLSKFSEYFCRVNVRRCLTENEREGRCMVESCGLSWAGTTYYNSDYYFLWRRMCKLILRAGKAAAKEAGLPEIAFGQLERQTEFAQLGGLTYHGVFVWLQQKDNYPANQYGMKILEMAPPQQFKYLYRNHYAEAEMLGIGLLERRMRQPRNGVADGLWRSFTQKSGRDYHNGMSYLLEGNMSDEQQECAYVEAMEFLQNFRLYRVEGCVEFLTVRTAFGSNPQVH